MILLNLCCVNFCFYKLNYQTDNLLFIYLVPPFKVFDMNVGTVFPLIEDWSYIFLLTSSGCLTVLQQ